MEELLSGNALQNSLAKLIYNNINSEQYNEDELLENLCIILADEKINSSQYIVLQTLIAEKAAIKPIKNIKKIKGQYLYCNKDFSNDSGFID